MKLSGVIDECDQSYSPEEHGAVAPLLRHVAAGHQLPAMTEQGGEEVTPAGPHTNDLTRISD